jgi:hypothetical protein
MKPLSKKERKEQRRLMRRISRKDQVSMSERRRYIELRKRDGLVPFAENKR